MTNAPPEDIRELRYRMTRVEADLADLKGDFYRRARSDKQAPAGGYIDWRPIETAPKDERVVLLGREDGPIFAVGRWIAGLGWCGDWVRVARGMRPTHWAPLNMPSERDVGDGK